MTDDLLAEMGKAMRQARARLARSERVEAAVADRKTQRQVGDSREQIGRRTQQEEARDGTQGSVGA